MHSGKGLVFHLRHSWKTVNKTVISNISTMTVTRVLPTLKRYENSNNFWERQISKWAGLASCEPTRNAEFVKNYKTPQQSLLSVFTAQLFIRGTTCRRCSGALPDASATPA